MSTSATTMQIGELADRTGLSLRTIRHYDEIGLLVPSGRSDGGYRLYTEEDLDRLLLIRRMKPLGFSLESMKELLDAVAAYRDAPTEENRARVDVFVELADGRRVDLTRQVEMADEFLTLLHAARGLGPVVETATGTGPQG